ncbi:MAG: hypothetical protein JXA93_10020 [Anaerolineae bacterium]|nr:hypothetical protein [Anaerolineae bacterium]
MAHTTVRHAAAPARNRRDRWADWAVLGVLALALLLGGVVMALAQGQRETVSNAEAGLTVRYPRGWLLKAGPAGDLAFQAVDPASGAFKTTLQVRVVPILQGAESAGASGAVTPTLALVLNNLSLSRAQQATAYRHLDMIESAPVGGLPAMEAHYVYVHEGGDLFARQMPVVVQGLDVVTARGDRAYVFSLLAAEDVFAAAEKEFRRFIASASLGRP